MQPRGVTARPPIVKNPSKAFHAVMWEQLKRFIPSLHGKRVCVPSSGGNHAVFAFALLGAQVTSCDIAANQLVNAQKAAEMPDEKNYEWPFWLSCEELVKGVTANWEEVDRMYDWRRNPAAALPGFLGVVGVKE